jgi:hypothetical protein
MKLILSTLRLLPCRLSWPLLGVRRSDSSRKHVFTCLYRVQRRMYRFDQSCPCGQDSRCIVTVRRRCRPSKRPAATSVDRCNIHGTVEMLGLGASTGSGYRLNLLVEVTVCQGVEQLLEKDCLLQRLQHLEYHDLIAEGFLVAGVAWKTSDGVSDKPVDVADRSGGHVVGLLSLDLMAGNCFFNS